MIQAEGPVAWLPSKSMRCPNCSTENPQGARFCIQCATPFKRVCPKCGFENPPEARFCAQCATSLTGLEVAQSSKTATPSSSPIRVEAENLEPPSDGERKTVTVLFADIKGSMELIEDLDPEEARAIVDPALKLMMEAVHRYDGYVAQSTGDGIFALFGAPVAHEDHPQRALYAALRMQEEVKRCREAAGRKRSQSAGPRGREHRRSGGAHDPDRRRACGVRADWTLDQPRLAAAVARRAGVDRHQRGSAHAGRRLLRA